MDFNKNKKNSMAVPSLGGERNSIVVYILIAISHFA
jgi:hypothetical protein